MNQRLEELITEIQVTRQKSKDSASQSSSDTRKYHKKWPLQQENLLCDLIVRFGTDFSLLQEYFPHKTRKQIKKKYREITERQHKKLDKLENEFQKERRKSFFDQQILEEVGKKEERISQNLNLHLLGSDIQQQSFF